MKSNFTNFKNLFLILSFWIGTASLLQAQNPFITTWNTDYGLSNSTIITIPTNPAYIYSYDVDWNNDGTFDDFGVTGDISHDYGTAGIYQVAIKGTFPAIYFNNIFIRGKITSIDQWGDINWESMHHAFRGCNNLGYTATDAPNLNAVTDMSYMFSNTDSFNGDLSNWNVINVTNMNYTFHAASSFNGDLSTWNVANVTNMETMFSFTNSFNGDLSNWNVANVTNMSRMFWSANSFNGDLSAWNVANVTNMESMFNSANSFNGDLSAWNVANVTDMSWMFRSANSFNGDLSAWNVANVTNMEAMFNFNSSFNRNLSTWNIANVSNMQGMFNYSIMSVENYDNTLIGWAAQSVQFNVDLGAIDLTYCNGETARNTLINTYGWMITGDVLYCVPACGGEAPTNTQINMSLPNNVSTDARATWDAVVGATMYQVKYRLKGTSNWTTAGSTSLQRNLLNLTKNKYYQYKVRANCASGWSDFSNIEEFYTSICDIPTGISSVYLDNVRMKIKWTNNGEVKAKVRYREVGTSTWYTKNSADGNSFVYITGLTPNAQYQYRVKSNCEGNEWSAYSDSYYHDLMPAKMAANESVTAAKIYPNPVNDLLNIEFETNIDKKINIIIINHLGKVIHSMNESYSKGIQRESIDVSSFANGYYFISIQGDDMMETFKFVKAR